jgi:Bacterial regulatory helix-turn-helix protein, lysR family
MNLRFVEAFHCAVALKGVTRAAERLHLTQSALSSRVAALERELGTLLLDRRDRQFRLTVAGRFHGLDQAWTGNAAWTSRLAIPTSEASCSTLGFSPC